MSITRIIASFFAILTFVGTAFVLLNHGQVSAGYAVIPMVFTMVFAFSKK